ncbi:NADAR family protein [Streptomyces sp. LHD-70]|uniref:NADAR family protein n=1 Tax=Streptomyces sp. LHD-70 TaxID=3072140 RepID=UPI00280F6612|nr:NADAR family protein [Streptomyces sp. LHD-70]MDQ8702582.1 NADAR family protein [Streptomyces sp. LHD-70]
MRENRIIHRTADGVRIPGTWRHAFIHNFDYHLTDLFIYADGLIDCWGLVTVEEFAEKLRQGWVATELPEGARASGHELAAWQFSEPSTWLTPEILLAEVRDTIEQLNRRPDSTARCLAAVDVFLVERTEENRAAARAAYRAIPVTQRRYALGDMDRKDGPLQVLVAGVGGRTEDWPDEPVTQEEYDEALAYFAERAAWRAEPPRVPVDGPDASFAPAIKLYQSFPMKRVEDPGTRALRHEYPAPITVAGAGYPSVAHAYWALSVDDLSVRAAIAEADTEHAARTLAADAPRREGWTHARTAVMTGLLRAKFTHDDLAEILLATDDATVIYDDDSHFWGDNGGRGRNWSGRLLELVRSELQARRAGIEPN